MCTIISRNAITTVLCLIGVLIHSLSANENEINTPGNSIEKLVPAIITEDEAIATIQLKDYMEKLNIPGFSIAMIRNHTIIWAKGYGEGMTSTTLFQAGDLSKPLTAMAVMHLVQKGTIDLDTDVNTYLKSWKIPKTSFNKKNPVTIRMLLNHTSGLVNSTPMFPRDTSVPTLLELLKGKKSAGVAALTFYQVPGTEFLYTNNGYAVLQIVLEEVTGKPFADFMKETVLSPIGMTHSYFEQPLLEKHLSHAAMPFDSNGTRIMKGPYTIPNLAAGGLWTTPSDLAAFAIHIQKILSGISSQVLSQQRVKEMLTPGKGNCGLGLFIYGKSTQPYFTHSGGTIGYISNLIAYEQGDGVVIMTPSNNGSQFNNTLIRTLAYANGWTGLEPLKVPKNLTIDPKKLEGLPGNYNVMPGMNIHITRQKNRLFARSTGQVALELFPLGDSSFYSKVPPAQLHFIRGKNGDAEKIILNMYGIESTAPRIVPITLRKPDAGVSIQPVRHYFDPKRKKRISKVWGDKSKNASGKVAVKNESIIWQYNSGNGWGCGITIPCNVPPLGKFGTVDLRGYRYLCFDVKCDSGKIFVNQLSEYKSTPINRKKYKGLNGSDAESFTFAPQIGTGAWTSYRVDLTDLDCMVAWGNQQGNKILDLQSISKIDFKVFGRQGKGVMEIKQVRFEK